MTAVADTTTLDWEAVARAAMHPTSVCILELLACVAGRSDPARSPVDLAAVTGLPLGVVAYHVRMLAGRGLITLARTEPVRGALAHYYTLSEGTVA